MEKKERIFRAVIIAAIVIAALVALILNIKIEPADRDKEPASSVASSQITSDILPTESDTVESAERVSSAPVESEKTSSAASAVASVVSKASSVVSAGASSRVTASEKASSMQAAISSSISSQQGESSSKPTPKTYSCTVEIRCDTILKNWDNLKPEKKPYVPESGMILQKVTVEFTEGETAFDILQRVTRQYDIQMEYRADGLFGGAYVEGIGHLYDFDCGDGSGWMYQINGYFPNYGCSSYEMKENDHMTWCYTCDVGQDVGDQYWSR